MEEEDVIIEGYYRLLNGRRLKRNTYLGDEFWEFSKMFTTTKAKLYIGVGGGGFESPWEIEATSDTYFLIVVDKYYLIKRIYEDGDKLRVDLERDGTAFHLEEV